MGEVPMILKLYLALAFKFHNPTFPPNFLSHPSLLLPRNANPWLALFNLTPLYLDLLLIMPLSCV